MKFVTINMILHVTVTITESHDMKKDIEGFRTNNVI